MSFVTVDRRKDGGEKSSEMRELESCRGGDFENPKIWLKRRSCKVVSLARDRKKRKRKLLVHSEIFVTYYYKRPEDDSHRVYIFSL